MTASVTGSLTPGTHSLPNGPTSIPNLEATSASLTGTSSLTSTSTSISSSLTSSSYDPSSTATDTDTNLPSIPTVNYPTPSPTAASDPKDRGVGAPFYLAIVLASISFIGCVAAFIAWWIRSRSRKHDLELDDPWNHRDSISDADSPFTENANEIEKGAQTHVETQTRPYYLPASIVRRSSSNLAVPHTIPTLEGGTLQNGFSRTMLDAGRFPSLRRVNEPRSQNSSSEPNPYRNVLSSEATNFHTRPGTERLQTGLSVQESTHTLGRLRVANRAPGDVTSGDEGGMNMSRIQNSARAPVPVEESVVRETHVDSGDRSVEEGDALLEPPGPATLSWGRRIDTVAALRRTRRRTPETTVQTYKNPRYGGHWYPLLDGNPSGAMRQTPVATNQEDNKKTLANPPPDPLGWTNTLKSSFWQAVDVMTRNRPSDPEPYAANVGNGSRFTPAPQRVTSRRSPVSPTRSTTGSAFTDTRTARSRETETKSEPTLPDNSVSTQEMSHNMTCSSSRTSSTRTNELGVPHGGKHALGRVDFLPSRVSHLNRHLNPSSHRRHPNSLKTDTGSVYSTDSAAARANLRKYGYVDSIPSSWSALGATRESQLDLGRTFLPLPRPTTSFSPALLSATPSQLTLESSLESGSTSVRTRTTMHSESDMIGSDASTMRSGKTANTANYREATTSSMYSMSRDGTIQSGHSTMGPGTAALQSSSTTSSMLSRKKGVATRRKRPRPPLRAPSTASSVQSVESGLSIREVAVRRALLERRKKVKAAESLKNREDSPTRSRSPLYYHVALS